jgi:23S rRNA (uracil1939-C5)-methyltransferase
MNARRVAEPETVEIIDLSDDGRGVAHPPGKVLFVHGALPGETVRVVRSRRRRGHDEARVDAVLEPAVERVSPGCVHFDQCGGCSLQHLASASQRDMKQRRLLRLFEEAGVAPETVFAPIAAETWRYRRRARLGVRFVAGKGRVLVGFREKFKPYIAVLDSCPVLAPPADTLLTPLGDLIGSLSIYNRLPQVEVCVADERTALVFRVLDPPTDEDLAALRAFSVEQGVDVWLQPGGLETIQPLGEPPPELSYRLSDFDLEFRFGPTDFIQVNASVNAQMVARAVELIAPAAGTRVLDLFCGIGNFSLALARSGASVTGVEVAAPMVERARDNARRNGIDSAEFEVADLFGDEGGWAWAGRTYDAVLLDPARAGAGPALGAVAATGAGRVVYVSCNPETLATDAAVLVREHGFELAGAGVIDMFPHTAHLESIALFERSV